MSSILIINPWPILRAGLRHILQEGDVPLTLHEAASTLDAREYMTSDLDLVILDPSAPDAHPATFVRQLRKEVGDVPILFFGGRDTALFASLAAKLGVNGYLGKDSNEKTIAATVQMVLAGMRCFPTTVESGASADKMQMLTQRELMVLLLLRQGARNIDIARTLYLSEKTVSTHKHNILLKLGPNAITQAVDSAPFMDRYPDLPMPLPGQGMNVGMAAMAM
jgi:DNA-binding NarL/FixJ family response regulator